MRQMGLLTNVNPHHVEGSHHHHRHQALLPLRSNSHSSVLLVDGLALGQGAFTHRVTPPINAMAAEDVYIGGGVETVVVSRGQIDDQLEKFGVFAELEVLVDEGGVLLGSASDQLAQGIFASLDGLALIS